MPIEVEDIQPKAENIQEKTKIIEENVENIEEKAEPAEPSEPAPAEPAPKKRGRPLGAKSKPKAALMLAPACAT